jgi:preprotein translocase subunit SecD
LRSAVESGWARARHTIIVADMISVLAAVLLYFFAVGGVRGFAFTLGLTTLIDLLVVFIFTKPLVSILARVNFFASGHKLSGFSMDKKALTESAEG